MIELRQVSAGYGRQNVLQDVSVSFENGTLTSVIGINGCGKSTLLKTIPGIIPSGGSITVDGESIAELSPTDIARKVAYLSQGKNTPDMTALQLVLHGRFPHLKYPRRYSKKDCEIAKSAMAQMGVLDFADKPLNTLSGGQRQNAYIAMALAQGTDHILLDEPTTYLDISHQLEVMKTLRNLADGGKTVVAVMHDLPMAFTFSDRIVLLHHGQIAANDTPDRLWGDKIIEETFGITLIPGERSYQYRY